VLGRSPIAKGLRFSNGLALRGEAAERFTFGGEGPLENYNSGFSFPTRASRFAAARGTTDLSPERIRLARECARLIMTLTLARRLALPLPSGRGLHTPLAERLPPTTVVFH
jgi:hypothetical protein